MASRSSIRDLIPKDKRTLFRSLTLAVLFIIPVVFGFWYIWRYAVNVPFWDQWDSIVPWTVGWYKGSFDFGRLFELQGDSRPVITNFLMLFISVSTALNIKAIFFSGYILLILSVLFLFYFIGKDTELDFLTLLLLIPIVYYTFNPFFMSRFILNMGALNYPLLLLTAFATLYLLHESRKTGLSFLFAIGMGVACTLTFSAGLSIWPAGLFQILIQKTQRKWEKAAAWTAAAAITFFSYFVLLGYRTEGLHSTGAYAAFVETTLRYPLNKFLCFMGSAGAAIIHDKQIALFFGLLILSIGIALLYVNRESLELNRFSKWFGLLAFGLLTTLEVTLTRSGAQDFIGSPDTIFFIPDWRHSYAIFLPLICIYVLAILYLKESMDEDGKTQGNSRDFHSFLHARSHRNLFAVGTIFMLLLSGIVLHGMPGISFGTSTHDQQIVNQYYLRNYADIPDEKLLTLHPNPGVVKAAAADLEGYNLSIFADPDPDPHLLVFSWLDPDEIYAIGGGTLEASYYRKNPGVRMGSKTMPGIFEHPKVPAGTVLAYKNITIHDRSRLRFSIGLDEGIWDKEENDGVVFEVLIHNPATNITEKVFSEKSDPVHKTGDRTWRDFLVPLDGYEGKKVSVLLVTRPGSNALYDWAWWGNPKIEW